MTWIGTISRHPNSCHGGGPVGQKNKFQTGPAYSCTNPRDLFSLVMKALFSRVAPFWRPRRWRLRRPTCVMGERLGDAIAWSSSHRRSHLAASSRNTSSAFITKLCILKGGKKSAPTKLGSMYRFVSPCGNVLDVNNGGLSLPSKWRLQPDGSLCCTCDRLRKATRVVLFGRNQTVDSVFRVFRVYIGQG